ncbi:hypothetical protein LJC23_06710 [Desulfovibrio sp. OttesenSCG-928-I05]|nr:hypothetical protein [Desulfovibrio sp. OttesenSCG-928-I05]
MEIALLVLYGLLLVWSGLGPLWRGGAGDGSGDGSGSGPGRTPAPGRLGRGALAFFVNNRAAGPLAVGFSIIVSCVGASATIGMIGLAFTVGTPAFWWLGSGAAGLVLLSFVLAGKVRESGAYTLPHMAESLLGLSARPAMSLLIVLAWTAILAAQFVALGRVLGPLTGLGPEACLAVGMLLIGLHTLGGQAAIMRADRVQALVLVACLAAMLCWVSSRNPGWSRAVSPEAVNDAFPASDFLYYLVIVGANYVVCPMLFGRMLSARDACSARLGGLVGAAGIMLCAGLIVAVGLACRGLVAPGTGPDDVLPAILAGGMPDWMRLVVSFALISAIVSSADSCLVTAATVLSFDLLGRRDAGTGRFCVIGLGLAGALVSLTGKGILGYLLMAYDVFACGVVVPVFVGLILHGKRRLNGRWSLAAVLVGGGLGLIAAVSGNTLFSYAGMMAALLLSAGGALRGTD